MNAFNETLQEYGADLAALRHFDEDVPELLPYATLVAARKSRNPDLAVLVGVYEWQESPLVFLVDGDQLLNDQERLNRIRRILAMRGDAPYLGVVLPGQLTLYRVSLDKIKHDRARIDLGIPAGQKRMTFAYLGNERPGFADRGRWISDVVLELLSVSIDDLKNNFDVSSNDAISLVGRALFTRFLGDRDLLPEWIDSKCFDDHKIAKKTSDWLDNTFNGDFLPLTPGLFKQLLQGAFHTLGNIMRRAPGGELFLGWEEKWDMLDFAHIPVGVLSQAYESYLQSHAPVKQKKEGGYYTPTPIANLMVRGAFHALRRDGVAHKAKILDPAAGAGVFLLTAFRHLVAERWRHDGKQPDTDTLRKILREQITGFDINEAALRFAALGLYLISIELDPNPEPVEKLSFKDLRGKVLHYFGDGADDEVSGGLGSLGDKVGDEHLGKYDLVIGNPPWASSTMLPGWKYVKNRVSHIAQDRLSENNLKPPLPNEALDLPFVWYAMEWAKPDGQISFALHARLLFQLTKRMPKARCDLFRTLNITGVVNGADLRNTKVWPKIMAPFCLLFARNQKPPPGAGFRFVSPYEETLNGSGSVRVDANNAEMITSEQIGQHPNYLKALFRGSQLDLEVYDRLHSSELKTLREFWQSEFGGSRNYLKFTGNGYQKLGDSSRVRKGGDGLKGVSAAYLKGLKELTKSAAQTRLVNRKQLEDFVQERIHDPRDRKIFLGPLLIFRETPSAHAGRMHTLVSDGDVIFNKSYNGYSARVHPDGKRLVRYLSLVIGSKVALWHALISSGKFGVERDVVEKLTVENLPIPTLETLKPSDIQQIDSLFDALVNNDDEETWGQIDAWVVTLYGLRKRDLQVITDTLMFNLPFSDNKKSCPAPSR